MVRADVKKAEDLLIFRLDVVGHFEGAQTRNERTACPGKNDDLDVG